MEAANVVSAMLDQGVSAEECYDFFLSVGLQDHSFVRDVLARLRNSSLDSESEFEPWSPGFTAAALDLDEFEPWSPSTQAEIEALMDKMAR